MKYKIAAFFAGRNGMDQLSKAILWPSLIAMIISIFLPTPVSTVVYILALAAMIYAYSRCFSKKLEKRQAENNAYLATRNFKKQRRLYRKTHKLYRCKKCKTVLRVPKGKGRVNITCRTCGNKFIRKT